MNDDEPASLGLDPRSVANLILSVRDRPTTNLELQKILYFVHGVHLTRTRTPLVSGYFEAWTHGPVHTAVYSAFKQFGAQPITSFARKKDLRTGEVIEVRPPTARVVRRLTRQTIDALDDLTAGQLVAMSHAKNGPWDHVFGRTKNERMLGLRISNELILERFRYHHLSARRLTHVEEPSEDTPLTYY
jgi:uncharacterized phage-associated protein